MRLPPARTVLSVALAAVASAAICIGIDAWIGDRATIQVAGIAARPLELLAPHWLRLVSSSSNDVVTTTASGRIPHWTGWRVRMFTPPTQPLGGNATGRVPPKWRCPFEQEWMADRQLLPEVQ